MIRPFTLYRIGDRVVQAVSYPTPDKLVFTRMIPGDPSSAVWVKEVQLQPCIWTKEYKAAWIHFATVKRTSAEILFPTDMLRYDSCSVIEDVSVDVRIYQVNFKKPQWHPERWASFGWQLIQGPSLEIPRG